MEEWAYDGMTYQINSMYLLPEDAWTYELIGPRATSDVVGAVAVVIPDATPDGEQFTPADATHAYVAATERPLPWPVLLHFVRFVESSGDIVSGAPNAAVAGDLSLSLNLRRFASRVFEVTSHHDGEHDGWCYELYEVNPTNTSNDYIYIRIPDLQPSGGPFVPALARQVTVAGHGNSKLPWPVFRHFLDAIFASGHVVDDQEG
ncbi:hypothetical protein ACQP2C_27445 [Micromonospora zamorensis]|uniref:hypothetical protein n=1 Tax=Micromonospora zamorensis TaxID=709883 RepID=UPI003D9818E4